MWRPSHGALSKCELTDTVVNLLLNRGKKMKIQDVLITDGLGGYYFDDFQAIKEGAKRDGFFYVCLTY